MTKKRETHRTHKSHGTHKSHRRGHKTASLKPHNNEAGRGRGHHGNVRWPPPRKPDNRISRWRMFKQLFGIDKDTHRNHLSGSVSKRRGGGEGRRRNTKKKTKKHRRHKKTKKHRRHKNEAGRGKEEEEEEEDEWDEERWGPAPWWWWNDKIDKARRKRENAQNEIEKAVTIMKRTRDLGQFDAAAKKIKDLDEMLETVLLPREKRAKLDMEAHMLNDPDAEW